MCCACRRQCSRCHSQPTSKLVLKIFCLPEKWSEHLQKMFDLLLRQKCGVPSLYPHQLVHGKDLNDRREIFLVIATGLGKSIVLFAPLIAAQARRERGIAFMIVPTKVLAKQQAEVGQKYSLRAIVINKDSVREAVTRQGHNLFVEFTGGARISVGMMSPQMLQGRRIGKLLNDPKIKPLVRWMLIDEAHVLNERGGTFREPYRAILHMRPRLPSTTVWAAVAGTATPSDALVIAAGLGFRTGQYVNARYTIDRPNIKYITRFFEHATSGFEFMDLSFVIPFGMKSPRKSPPPSSSSKTIQNGHRLMQFLDSLILLTIPNHIPTLTRVIIVHIGDGLGDSPEVGKQQMGRPGRDGSPATAIVYAPAWVREVPEAQITTKQGLLDLERRKQLPAVTHQFFNPTAQCCPRGADLNYYGEKFVLRPNCCSLHDPEPEQSRDLALVGKWVGYFKAQEQNNAAKVKTFCSDGTYPALDTIMKTSLTNILIQWQARKYNVLRKAGTTGGGSVLLLPTHLLQRIVDQAHACTSLDRLQGIIHDWQHLELLDKDLFEILAQALPGYSEILKARDRMDVEPLPTPELSDRMDVDVLPLRIVIRPPRPPSSPKKITAKRTSPASPTKTARKRSKVKEKENTLA
ncbi:hypothetical protein B0H10DRAFT_2185737 [Mycena sp. CBHHK59/15]|nr:hypothetical protein B0H10DRAFT_2185737 [Mycena sp. CBHHK59/15]